VIAVAQHGLPREQISRGCRRTVETLQENGFKAFVVGGAVRDLLPA
jgi:poly(A) polymerase